VKTELLLKSRKGKQIPALLLSTPITSTARNGALLYQTAIIDLRERKTAEEALRAKEAELEAIINRTPFMLTRCSRDLRYRFVSRAYAEMLGRPAEEINGRPIIEIVGKKAFKTILPYVEKALQGHRIEYETEVPYRGARPRSMHSVYTPDRDGQGNVIGWFGSIFDISKRKQAEDALRQSKNLLEKRVRARTAELRAANEELNSEISRRKGLEGQILEISDREQERLGQELHDGLCQQLTAIGFLARATALRLKDHRVVRQDDLEKIAQLINSSVMDARNIALDLHKEEIDAAEFLPALRDLVDRKIWQTSCRLDLKAKVNIEDDNVASQLYRILREALINANKHARATQIMLEVRRSKNDLVFSVTDNGVGFSTKTKTGHGLGFHIMKYRAESIGARLELESLKKGGTRVACYLPMTMIK
jgi:PAS domain S-box-containing protein